MESAHPTWTKSFLEDIGIRLRHGQPAPTPPAAPASKTPAPKAEKAEKVEKAEKAEAKAEPAPAKEKKGKDKKEAKPATTTAAPSGPFVEATPEKLAKMSKDERTAYHIARIAHQKAQKEAAGGGAEASGGGGGAKTKAERRALQEAQRKVKEDQHNKAGENAELLAELKLQGLSEEQAREVMAEILKEEAEGKGDEKDDDDDDEDVEDLMASVKRWMGEQPAKIEKDAMRDFNMQVRFQGHVDTCPPDHIRAVLQLLCEEACKQCDLSNAKLQPGAVAKKAQPLVDRWMPLLKALYGKIDDVLEGADCVCQAVQTAVSSVEGATDGTKAAALVGCLMAIRENDDDLLEDEDLLTGCKRIEPRSAVLDKYIEFLEDAADSGSGSDSGSD